MRISPRYDTDPVVRLDGSADAVAVPLLRQRRRFAEIARTLAPDQWAAPSRCDGWRVQDVVAHLTSTDQFWNLSIAAGVAGDPTRLLTAFDPKATPAALVDAARGAAPAETLTSYLDASEALCVTIEALDDQAWDALAETPLGHVTVTTVAHHALWDSWVHERDVLQPLGITQDLVADEIVASLRYAAALAPALGLHSTKGRTGALAVDVTRPDARIVVTVGEDVRVVDAEPPPDALVLRGDAVEVLEALSLRAPWPQPIPPGRAWMLAGISEMFESERPAG